MYATYTLTEDELNLDFLEGVKKMFNGSQIRLTIENFDETEYLMRSERNHQFLMESIKNVNERKNLIEIPIGEIEKALNETNSI
jgi:hypothetical protein